MPPKKTSSIDEPLTERRFTELLELTLESILDRKLKNIIAPINAKIEKLETECNNLRAICDKLQVTQTLQQTTNEFQEISARSKNIIITGLKESVDTKTAIQEIINFVTPKSTLDISPTYEFWRLGSDKSHSRPVKVVLASNEISSKVKKNAKLLREHDKFKGVYVNPDLPPATSKENARLRNLAKEIRRANPADTVYIRKGKLIHNDNIVDSFNILNQIQTKADADETSKKH